MLIRTLLAVALMQATALRDGQVVIQTGNNSRPEIFAFSPRAHLLASTGFAHHGVNLYDLQSRLMVRTFATAPVRAITFNKDGTLLAIDDGAITLYDVATGAVRHRLDHSGSGYSYLAFSADGASLHFLEGAGRSHRLKIWKIGDKQARSILEDKGLYYALPRPSTNEVLAPGPERSFLIDAITGQKTDAAALPIAYGDRRVYSADGQRLLHFTAATRSLRLLDGATLAEIAIIPLPPEAKLALSDAKEAKGRAVQLYPLADPARAYVEAGERLLEVRLSDGKISSSRDWPSPHGVKARNSFEPTVHDRIYGGVAGVTPDGALVVEMGTSGTFYPREIETGVLTGKTGDKTGAVQGIISFDARGELIMVGPRQNVELVTQQRVAALDTARELTAFTNENPEAAAPNDKWAIERYGRDHPKSGCYLYDASLRRTHALQGFTQKEGYDTAAEVFCGHRSVFSADGRYAIFGKSSFDLWDLESHKMMLRVPVPAGWQYPTCAFSADGSAAACSNETYAPTKETLLISVGDKALKGKVSGNLVALSRKGTWLVTDETNRISLWSTANLEKRVWPKTLPQPTRLTWDFAPDETYVAIAESSIGGRSFLWRLADDAVLALPGTVANVRFNADGTLMANATRGGDVLIVDVATRTQKQRLVGHVGRVDKTEFAPNNERLLTQGEDLTHIVWSLERGEQLVTIATQDDDYVMVTPDNYYMGRGTALARLALRLGARAYPLGQFDLSLNRPDLVLQRLGHAPKETIELLKKSYLRRLERSGIAESAVGMDANLPSLELKASVPPATSERRIRLPVEARSDVGLLRIELEVNGVPVLGARGLELQGKPKSFSKTIEVDLATGPNTIRVRAVDAGGAESLAAERFTVFQGPARKPDLYLVTVGVSKYQAADYALRYAAKDAADLAAVLRTGDELYGSVKVLEVLDEAATIEGIAKARDFFASAKIDDVAVLFIAGHGLIDGSARYYFATHDMNFDNPAARGMPFEALEGVLASTPARHRLLLMDTCASGETDEEEVARSEAMSSQRPAVVVASRGVKKKGGAAPGAQSNTLISRELFANLRRTSGANVIASSSGVELSFESDKIGNGVFTHVLMKGLKGAALPRAGGSMMRVSDLRFYVSREVEALTAGLQHPVARQKNADDDFSVFPYAPPTPSKKKPKKK